MSRFSNMALSFGGNLLRQGSLLAPRTLTSSFDCGRFYSDGGAVDATVEASLQKWHKAFLDDKISQPKESIANLLAFTLKINDIAEVYNQKDRKLTPEQQKILESMCKKRLQRMPVQYIIGEWNFRSITLKLRPPVFIPWVETEMLVEKVVQHIKKTNTKKVLELCCGSGAISLALLKEIPQLEVITIDKSPDACNLCLENGRLLGVDKRLTVANVTILEMQKLLQGGKFDLIVSNPPYQSIEDMLKLTQETLLYEDLGALKAGEDGLDIVRQIFSISSNILSPGGRLILEVGSTHPQLIKEELSKIPNNKLRLEKSYDLSSRSRCVEIVQE